MADTFHEIYRNASLGATQLDDGEETIVSTNSTTSYVIKDMYVNGTSTLTGTYLELNGFNVGSITKNATGSLVIPPNSTLKLKTTDYPLAFYKETLYAIDTSGRPMYEERMYIDGSDDRVVTDGLISNTSGYFQSYTNDTMKLSFNHANNNYRYWYIETHDDNSVQTIQRLQQSNNSLTQQAYQNYVALGIGKRNDGVDIIYGNSGSNMHISNLDQYPLNWPNSGTDYVTHSISPYPTSSYPRHFFFQDHIWYRPSSGYNGNVYAMNIHTGSVKGYPVAGGYSTGKNWMCVSHDARDDKLYVWEGAGGAFYVTELPHTLTHLLNNSSSNSGGYHAGTSYYAPTPGARTNTGIQSRIQNAPHGGVQFTGTDDKLYEMDKDGNIMGDPFDKTNITIQGNSNTKDYLAAETVSISAATAAANGISAPTFGLQLLGVKSTI